MFTRISLALALILLLFLSVGPLVAQGVPYTINYQGKLTDNTGQPVADASYNLMFRFYTVPVGGTPVWVTPGPVVVNTFGGVFSAMISGIPDPIFDLDQLYLETMVTGQTLAPRQPIVSVGYSYRANKAYNVSDGCITGPKIANGAIKNQHIASDAQISGSKISGGSGSGLDADMLDGLHAGSFVTGSHNHDSAYVNEGQADSITSGMITDGTIDEADIGWPFDVSVSALNAAVLKGKNTDVTKGYGLFGEAVAISSDGYAAGIVGTHGNPQAPYSWNTDYRRMGVYGYGSYHGISSGLSAHGVVGWSEYGYGGLFHSSASDALAVDGTSRFTDDMTLDKSLVFSGNNKMIATSGLTIDGPGDLDIVIGSNDITIRGESSGTYIKIKSDGTIELKAATNLNITAGTNLNLSAPVVNINGTATVDVDGGLITLN